MYLPQAIRRVVSRVRDFHEDEDGATTLESVMMLAVAALVVVALVTFGGTAMEWLRNKWNEIAGSEV